MRGGCGQFLPDGAHGAEGRGDEKEAPLSEDAKRGKQRIQLSYTLRMFGLGAIAILGVTLPWFQSVAVLLPMLFPRIVIAVEGLLMNRNNSAY